VLDEGEVKEEEGRVSLGVSLGGELGLGALGLGVLGGMVVGGGRLVVWGVRGVVEGGTMIGGGQVVSWG